MGKIHVESRAGDAAAVQKLLDKGEDVNALEMLAGWSPLHCAAGSSHPEVVALLLGRGADVSATGKMGGTALHAAEDPESVRLLLAAGADPIARTNKGATPLHSYAKSGNLTCAAALIDAGVDVDVRDADGRTPLCDAAASLQPSAVELLLERGADPNARTAKGQTPLDLASALGGANARAIELLTAAGAARAKIGRLEASVAGQKAAHAEEVRVRRFMDAVRALDARTVKQMLAEGQPVDTFDGEQTALHWAIASKGSPEVRAEIVRLLVGHGADVNRRTATGLTAGDRQRYWGAFALLEKTSDYFTGGSMQTGIGYSPLDLAAMYNRPDLARLLIEAGADVNSGGEDGQTALHLCVPFIAPETAAALIAGAPTSTRGPISSGGHRLPLRRGLRRVVHPGSTGNSIASSRSCSHMAVWRRRDAGVA